LNLFPEIGRIVPEIGDPKIRELIIYSYRLIYEIYPDKLAILALVHGKRDFTKINLKKEDKNLIVRMEISHNLQISLTFSLDPL